MDLDKKSSYRSFSNPPPSKKINEIFLFGFKIFLFPQNRQTVKKKNKYSRASKSSIFFHFSATFISSDENLCLSFFSLSRFVFIWPSPPIYYSKQALANEDLLRVLQRLLKSVEPWLSGQSGRLRNKGTRVQSLLIPKGLDSP